MWVTRCYDDWQNKYSDIAKIGACICSCMFSRCVQIKTSPKQGLDFLSAVITNIITSCWGSPFCKLQTPLLLAPCSLVLLTSVGDLLKESVEKRMLVYLSILCRLCSGEKNVLGGLLRYILRVAWILCYRQISFLDHFLHQGMPPKATMPFLWCIHTSAEELWILYINALLGPHFYYKIKCHGFPWPELGSPYLPYSTSWNSLSICWNSLCFCWTLQAPLLAHPHSWPHSSHWASNISRKPRKA